MLEARELLKTWGASLNARESEITEKESFLNEIERRLNERKEALRRSEADLFEREASLNESAERLRAREASLSERERFLSENEADYLASERLIADLRESLKKASVSLAQAHNKIRMLEIERNFWRAGGIAGWVLAIAAAVFAALK